MNERSIRTIPVVGGHIALDLLNTCDWRSTPVPLDHLSTFDDLILWLKRLRHFPEEQLADIGAEAVRRPAAARAALREIKALRDCLHELIRSAVEARVPPSASLAYLQHMWRTAVRSGNVTVGSGCEIRLAHHDRLRTAAHHLAIKSVDLLTSEMVDRIHMCERDGCGWFFLDRSRKQNRRWCSMQDCGNVMKQNRYRLRSLENQL